MINVLLVEDQAMVRGALKVLLNMENDITVVAEASNGLEALNILENETTNIDLILSDIEMPELTGIELFEALADSQIKKVIVTTFGKAGYIKRAINAGVHGFLLKDAPSNELANALRNVILGKRVIDTELALTALDDNDPLSEKERKALRLAGEGKKTQEIANILCLSEGTVRNYLSEAISKLNATNRVDAARLAQQKGWL